MDVSSSRVLWIILLVVWSCDGFDKDFSEIEKTQKTFQSRYWQYVSLNGSSPLFFHNFDNITGSTQRRKEGRRHELQSNRNAYISHRLQSIVPTFALISEGIQNRKCLEDSQTFLHRLNEMDLWALKMHDSCGKIPAGLLNGNVNQFGDFDECLSIDEPELRIKGKYCLAYFQVHAIESGLQANSKVQTALKLLHSHYFFRSKLTDPGHRVPRFSTLNWGLCVPNSCSSVDVENHLKSIVEPFLNGTGLDVEVKVEPEMCQENKEFEAPTSFLIVSCLLLSVVMTAFAATIRDVYQPETGSEKSSKASFDSAIQCFSLKKNLKALLNLNRTSDDIQSAHGVRMANALMLVLCHKSMALFFMPYSNRTFMVEKLSQPWSVIARIASLYTDSFIMLSGLLTSYSFVKTLDNKGKLNLKIEYLNRLIRIIPPLAVVILMSTFVVPELGSGPQWNLVVSHHAEKCRQHWWKNLLFVHNYFGFENMCLTHTHHMGIDTQLFLISPVLIFSLFKWPFYGACGLVAAAAVSTMARYETTIQRNLSFFIYPGITVSQMFDTANHSYIIPFHRLTSYVIGIFLGFALRRYGKTLRMKSSCLRIGWTITFTLLSYILMKGYDMNKVDYDYNSREAAVYAALAPVAWCLFVGWIIFITQTGHGGYLGKFISSRYFLIWTRLSYSVYLTQFPIFFFNVGFQRYPQNYSILLLVNILEYIVILGASILLTLFFDMPFVNLKKLILPRENQSDLGKLKKQSNVVVSDRVSDVIFSSDET